MRKHHDNQNPGTGGGFGKTDPDDRQEREARHVNDKDFKKGKSTPEQRGDEDEL